MRQTLLMLRFFTAEIGSKVLQLLPSYITLKIFCKRLTPREQRKCVLTLENMLSSLDLKTGTVNNYMIINNISLQRLHLGAIRILGQLYAIKVLLVRNSTERKCLLCIFY